MPESSYSGIIFIGDPHISSRVVGFRRDDFGRTVLGKIAWCLEFAREQNMLPVFLGDLFNYPRDNANWLIGELVDLLGRHETYGIYGNHDCQEDSLGEHDSLDILVKSRHYRLLSLEAPLRLRVDDASLALYGASWNKRIPGRLDRHEPDEYGVLVSHHDVRMPGYEEIGRFGPFSIEDVGLVVNGHIHTQLADRIVGTTAWTNPGNISRTRRSDAVRAVIPSALVLQREAGAWIRRYQQIPHRPYEEVFHEAVADGTLPIEDSAFVKGLAELQARRSESGAGLLQFLEHNLGAFEAPVRAEIESLAAEALLETSAAGSPTP